MARRREQSRQLTLREEIAEAYRARDVLHAYAVRLGAEDYPRWREAADALDAGRPVKFEAAELKGWLPELDGLDGLVVVMPDGSVRGVA